MTAIADRIAGAPISWGVCEVPGWGWQHDFLTVLSQMQEVALAATELGPDGFLPGEPGDIAKTLADNGLRAVGGFVPVLLHDPLVDPVPQIEQVLASFTTIGAGTLVLAAATGMDGYDARTGVPGVPGVSLSGLDEDGWHVLLRNLDRIDLLAAAAGITATLHPHVGTMVETSGDVDRVLGGSGIGLCLDTGHLLIGGGDPVALAADHAERVRHTHLKDVDATWLRRVQSGAVSYSDAVRGGMYRPLGRGDVDIASIVGSLEHAGYDGWYVLEQDTILPGPPPHGRGPTGRGDQLANQHGPMADVRASIEYLSAIARHL